jgi:hypothetical protein
LVKGYDAKRAEREAKNPSLRKKRFLNPRQWKHSRNKPENIWRMVVLPDKTAVRVTVFFKDGFYGVYLAGPTEEDHCCPPHRYTSQSDAKCAAFDLIECLKECVLQDTDED